MPFRIKRIYETAKASDGVRVLVDRLWPRGIRKTDARLDHWMKDVAPSPELRTWFAHDSERFAEFARRYKAELKGNTALAELRKMGSGGIVTLLYAAHDAKVNHALVLQQVLGRTSRKV
jgi:uncharacterized protein YeaO (DUF488 family)